MAGPIAIKLGTRERKLDTKQRQIGAAYLLFGDLSCFRRNVHAVAAAFNALPAKPEATYFVSEKEFYKRKSK